MANKLDPENAQVLLKVKDIAIGNQESDKAAKALLKLANILKGRDSVQAKEYLLEASKLDASNEMVRSRLAALENDGGASSPDTQRVPLARVRLQSVPASQVVQESAADPTDDWLSESVDLDDLNLDDIELDLSLDELGDEVGHSIDGSFELSLDGFEADEELGFEIDLEQLDGAQTTMSLAIC